MQTVKTLSLKIASGIAACVYTAQAYAQAFAGPTPDLGIPGGADEGSIRQIITDIVIAVLNFLALIAVIIVIIAGIRLILSQGEDEAKDKAKKTIFYALIGLLIVLFARVIVGLITVYLANQV